MKCPKCGRELNPLKGQTCVKPPKITSHYRSTMQAAKEAGISDARVRQMIGSGKVPAIKIGSSWMIHTSDVADIVNRKDGRRKKA